MGGCHSRDTVKHVNNENRVRMGARHESVQINRAINRVDAIEKSITIQVDNVELNYAYVSQRGSYPEDPFKANQDSYCIHHRICKESDAFFGVFDGHGNDGDACSIFSKTVLPQQLKQQLEASGGESRTLNRTQMHEVLTKAHVSTNDLLRRDKTIDDSLSGTTAISVYFHGNNNNRMTVSNVGDSRAVLGQSEISESARVSLKALPLSRDQTPYRKDEKARIRRTGARVLSLDQLEGLEPIEQSEHGDVDEFVLGDQLDEGGDPPRVWHPDNDYPGTAFTRSIGDSVAEELGVYAVPELLNYDLQSVDKILVIASDGVYEFLTNQSVIDICAKFSDPLEACRAVVAEAYELWLQYELRTDDITIICIFINRVDDPKVKFERQCSSDNVLSSEDMRPVRKNVSKEKSKEIEKLKKNAPAMVDEVVDLEELRTPKSEQERTAIADAIKASVLFRSITPQQRELVFDCMESINVKAGSWVIRQGQAGDRFYIVDDGTLEVRIQPDGQVDVNDDGGDIVHMYEGSRERHAHPSFGELALLHSAPRSASIIAKTDGHLWALHRAAFRLILSNQDHRQDLKRALLEIPYFSHLDADGINQLSALMEDVTFGRGDTITEQGVSGDKMFVVESGSVYCTQYGKAQTDRTTLKAGSYFGEEILDHASSYSKTIMALQTTTCWQLDKKVLESTMGPLLFKGSTSPS